MKSLRPIFFTLVLLNLLSAVRASPARWSEIIENRVLETGLKLENKDGVLIRKCQITNPEGTFGITLTNCHNVRIDNCVIHRIGNEAMQEKGVRLIKGHEFVPPLLDHVAGILLNNCTGVDIVGNEITDSASKGVTVVITPERLNESVETLIEGNRIAYIYDDGIDFNVTGGRNHPNLKGVTIRNNLIHDIGTGLTRLGFARHGMYLSVRDAVVEGNTIYNCYYGQGISVRNSGVIRNNKVRNCASACIAYWAQAITEGGAGTLLIEGNECRQDFAIPIPIRHISFPDKLQHLPLGALVIQHADNPQAKMKQITIRNNRLLVGADYAEDNPVISGSGDPSKGAASIVIEGNTLTDMRKKPHYFGNIPAGVDITRNELLQR